jgi:hypothetical protein
MQAAAKTTRIALTPRANCVAINPAKSAATNPDANGKRNKKNARLAVIYLFSRIENTSIASSMPLWTALLHKSYFGNWPAPGAHG